MSGKGYKVTAAERAALDANTSTPSASNAFATMTDIVAGTNPLATAAGQAIASQGANRVQSALAGVILTDAVGGTGASIELAEPPGGGTSKVKFIAPALSANRTVTLKDSDGTIAYMTDIAGSVNPSVGSVGTAMMPVTVNFVAGENVVIGADTYIARVAPAAPKDFAFGANVDAALDSLATVINTEGTEKVFANGPTALGFAGSLFIQFASAVGGPAVVGVPTSMALSSTNVAALWDKVNLNTVGTAVSTGISHGRLSVTAAQAAYVGGGGTLMLGSLPFALKTSSVLVFTVTDSAGTLRAVTDKFSMGTTPGAAAIAAVNVAANGATHLASGDIVSWTVIR